jgi:hypothetical protein
MTRRWAAPLVLVLLSIGLAAGQPALASPTSSAAPQKTNRFKAAVARVKARFTGSKPKSSASSSRLGIRESLRRAREELQLYRGRKLERWSDRLAYGRSDFNPGRSVGENLADLAADAGIPTFTRTINGRPVLHLVVDLGQGKKSTKAIRRIFKRVADSTVEVNFKAPGGKNTAGHVAIRVGDGATYDLTGTEGVVQLPGVVERPLRFITGRNGIVMPRKRSLRRFFETRKDRVGAPPVFYGMLFQASAGDIKSMEKAYEQRLGQVKQFSFGGGDPEKGVFSCAQFLTHDTPFLAERGIRPTVSAMGMAHSAATSPALAAVIVYKMPSTAIAELPAMGGIDD